MTQHQGDHHQQTRGVEIRRNNRLKGMPPASMAMISLFWAKRLVNQMMVKNDEPHQQGRKVEAHIQVVQRRVPTGVVDNRPRCSIKSKTTTMQTSQA